MFFLLIQKVKGTRIRLKPFADRCLRALSFAARIVVLVRHSYALGKNGVNTRLAPDPESHNIMGDGGVQDVFYKRLRLFFEQRYYLACHRIHYSIWATKYSGLWFRGSFSVI